MMDIYRIMFAWWAELYEVLTDEWKALLILGKKFYTVL